jgi:2-polyprenyl-3-methyl-5-hydroxy-6-metoxy-1,4-benzoquinol methylase
VPPGVELESRVCPLGCAADDELLLRGHDWLQDLPGMYDVVRCRGCGLMRTNPRPTPATIGFYYPESYGPYHSTQIRADEPGRGWRTRLRGLFDFRTEALPPLPPGRMLEVGCASGRFLHQMAQRGWTVEGIEFSERAARAAQAHGYRVHIGPVESAPEPEEQYDLVVAWMVVEHLHDPLGVLEKLWRWTRPGGWLAFSVPNAAAAEFRYFRADWYGLQAPVHLFHYTPASIRRLLARAGWQTRRIQHQRIITNLVYSLGYRMKGRGRPGMALALQRRVEYDYSAYLLYPLSVALAAIGQTGRMTIWAQRPPDESA